MPKIRAAIYARVSSEQQAQAGTIQSQIDAVLERVEQDGLPVPPDCQFIDDGYSGTTLVRPALDRLRDNVYAGLINRIYVYSPDRLSRKYAYQILLIDEFRKAGVEVVFLNSARRDTPEDELLLQVQGMMAEYERAKFLERSRRGRLHAARRGAVSVFGAAPYGYQYIPKKRSLDGEAHFEINPEEAKVVRQVYDWVCKERATLSEVCRRLKQSGVKTRSGKTHWVTRTIWGILKNPAYTGTAKFGRTKSGPRRTDLRMKTYSLNKGVRTRDHSVYATAPESWINIPVPQLISESLYEIAQKQLAENRARARVHREGARYLLQGIIACDVCGRAFYGTPVWCSKMGRMYMYYKCPGSDPHRCTGGKRTCRNLQIRGDLLESAICGEIETVLQTNFSARLIADWKDTDWDTKRKLLRSIVQRVGVSAQEVTITFRSRELAPKFLESNLVTPTPLQITLPRSMFGRASKSNSLRLLAPEIAKQWHPRLNGGLTPDDVAAYSHKVAWWLCDCGHTWQAAIGHRSKGYYKCSQCKSQSKGERQH